MPALLPWGVKQFCDGNGSPLVAGWVAYCQVGTGGAVLRNVYGDEGETVLLQNPVPLDASGRPYSGGSQQSIWGDGTYEEYVYDSQGVLQTTSIIDTQSGAAATAAASGNGTRIGAETNPETEQGLPRVFRQHQQLGTTLGFPITRGGFATTDDHGYSEVAFAEPFQFLGTIICTPFTSPESRHHGHEHPFVMVRRFTASGFTAHSRPHQDFFWMAAGS